MIKYNVFKRSLMAWRMSDFRKVHDLSEITELPYGSVLHVFDNFPMDGHIEFGPRASNHFLKMNNFRVFMHNLTMWPEHAPTDAAPIDKSKLILTNAGVMVGLMKYKRDMMPRILYVDKTEEMPDRPSTMAVINYNPLFRARTLGNWKKIRFFNFFLAQLVNEICKLPNRQHFIHVPLENVIFERKDFIRLFKKFDRISCIYPQISSYLMLANFYGIIAKQLKMPKRDVIPDVEQDANDDTIVATESFEVDIGDQEPDISAESFMSLINEAWLSDNGAALEALKDGENPFTNSMFEFINPRLFEKINFIFTCGNKFVCYNLRDLKDMNGTANVGIIRIVNHINNLIRESGSTAETPLEEEVPMVSEDVGSIREEDEEKGNMPKYTAPMTKQEQREAAEIDVLELENIDGLIKSMPDLSTAQISRIGTISKAYKKLEIGGDDFEKILKDIPEDEMAADTIQTGSTKDGSLSVSATASSTAILDKEYVDKKMKHDLARIVTSFSKEGMFLVDFKEMDECDELNEFKHYTATYEDANHKKHTLRIPLPVVDGMGRCKINGTIKMMTKQRVSNPICKVSKSRITLMSNYNKALVERNENSSHSFFKWFVDKAIPKANRDSRTGFKIKPVIGTCKFKTVPHPFEITELGAKFTRMDFSDGVLVFDYANKDKYIKPVHEKAVEELEQENGFWFGYRKNQLFFITLTGVVNVIDATTRDTVFVGAFGDFFEWISEVPCVAAVEYVDITYLSKTLPLIHLLAYKYGLTEMLKYCNCDYELFDKGARFEKRPSDIIIPFSDKKLIIHRTQRNNSLLFGGLTAFDLDQFSYEEMDDKNVYYMLLQQKGLSLNNIKGIDAFFSLFIDPITRDVLRELHEPTDIRDLLLRAVTLLTTSDHVEEASAVNFRFRGVEMMTGIVYNEMARALAQYKGNPSSTKGKWSISDYTIKSRIIKEQLMDNVSTINPMDDIKSYSKFTGAGSGGRSAETFMTGDRRFTQDSIGIVSEATVDNGKVGMVAILPANPILTNSRGMAASHIDISKLEPENVLSFNSLVMPGVCNDD